MIDEGVIQLNIHPHGKREGALNYTRPPSHGVKGRRKGSTHSSCIMTNPWPIPGPLPHQGAAPIPQFPVVLPAGTIQSIMVNR